ncbi:ATP-binding protein [Orientia tsutsugamushi]|uniref:sensor histidine kinase n=1 Tax=Orientia tsutsugamushi TaxID=784 RepID=UPI00061E8938|nr:ATP-binding protein [Orientia tsutsugamushi]KJV70039.1 histidine kinase-, DNA gyrase B-, and HSP90-like ATPase family protein [Orientia tsutsugamushi str. TA763]SPP24560.1 ATP-binding protein [Orientia tsutsugamushi]
MENNNIEEKDKQTNLYSRLEAGKLARINCIDSIQYIRHIVNTCTVSKLNIEAKVRDKGLNSDSEITKVLTDTSMLVDNVRDHLNDIIFLFRQTIESTNVELAEFSLRKMLNGTIAAIRVIDEDEKIELREGNDIYDIITGDSFRIRAVLTQLVGSAIMHSTNSKVRVSIDFLPPKNEQSNSKDRILKFVVHSVGDGISKNKLQEMNSELKNPHLIKHQALDSGLEFIKHLTYEMKGSIKIESKEGHYTKFLVSIPIQTSNLNSQH